MKALKTTWSRHHMPCARLKKMLAEDESQCPHQESKQ